MTKRVVCPKCGHHNSQHCISCKKCRVNLAETIAKSGTETSVYQRPTISGGPLFGLVISLVPLSSCVGLWVLLFIGSMLAHNHKLNQYEKTLRKLQHPTGTSLVTSTKWVGGYTFANGCDYFVGELRRYDGSTQEIEAFYTDQAVDNPVFEDVTLEFGVTSRFLRTEIPPVELEMPQLGGKHYLVYIWAFGDPFFDYRCR